MSSLADLKPQGVHFALHRRW